jgi:hypothetical protein
MNLFGRKMEKEELEIIEHLLHQESTLISIIDRLTTPTPPVNTKPFFTLSLTIQNQIYLMANVALVIGSPKTGLFTLIDNKTLLPITGVKYSNQALGANSNPEFATFALALTDPNDPTSLNSVAGTPVAAGTGTVVITTDANYTDPGDQSAKSGSFSITKTFVVQLAADGATFDVVFP